MVSRKKSMVELQPAAGTSYYCFPRWTVRRSSAMAVAALVTNLSSFAEGFSPPLPSRADVFRCPRHEGCARERQRLPSPSVSASLEASSSRHEYAANRAALWPAAQVAGLDSSTVTRSRRRRYLRQAVTATATAYVAPVSAARYATTSSGYNGKGAAPTGIPAVVLRRGDAVEFWHAKALILGNYEGPVPERRSLTVRAATGEVIVIDAGQIVGVWSYDTMRGPLPVSSAQWRELQANARALLQGMPAKGLDLSPFWLAASSKGKGFVVTTAHAAEFVFGRSQAQVGLKKRRPFDFHR